MLSMNNELSDFIPKSDTQQRKFLERYPEFDGRGLLIAIIDSGVDVSLPGMQKTSTGLPKIYDCFDFTGSGNIDTSTVVEIDMSNNNKNTVVGLSGRILNIPSTWKNPSGKWHFGKKLFKELIWKKCFQNTFATNENPQNSEELGPSNNLMVDCIVWFDGEKWQACLDTSFVGDLENVKVLTNFRDDHEHAFITDKIAYCITVHQNGNLLEIFLAYSEHGTFIAHIAAGHFPGEPEKDGLAPGAQIVSMNVSTSTLTCSKSEKFRSLETLKKALLKCIELKVDIVNFSIMFKFKNDEINDLLKDMIEKHGKIICQGAGNSGPLFSSIDQETTLNSDSFLLIGSVLTAEMKNQFFPFEEADNDSTDAVAIVASHSSRGPLTDASRGITVTAPGGAITELPRWSLSKNRRHFGTSCAAPNASGLIACLLSALKTKEIQYSPALIKLALCNTAYLPPGGNKLEFGNGIIQINSAFEFLQQLSSTTLPPMITVDISIRGLPNLKGILMIKKDHKEIAKTFYIKIKQNFGTKSWILKSSPDTVPFVKYTKTVTKNIFSVEINTNSLALGSINYAEISEIDSSQPFLGSIFHLPITVIIPERISKNQKYCIQKSLNLEYEIPFSYVFIPPFQSQKCKVKITVMNEGNEEEEISPTYLMFRYSEENGEILKLPKYVMFDGNQKEHELNFSVNYQKFYQLTLTSMTPWKIQGFKLTISFDNSNHKLSSK